MADFSRLTPDEQKRAKALDPRQAVIRTIDTDHNGNVHMLLMWPAEYVKNMGIKQEDFIENRQIPTDPN